MAHSLPFTSVVVTTVKPFQKTAHIESIDPISMDWTSADSYVPLFFAYRLADKSEAVYLRFLRQIKESLQKVLVPFFSFAGRWIAIPEGGAGRKLLCNDEGVPLVEAFLDRDLDSVVHASAEFQPVPELQGYGFLGMDLTQYRQKMQPDGLPCIFVQVTRFRCGGVVLALTFNHMHTDGKGFFNFMTAWSDISRVNETTIKVDHTRALAEKESFKSFLSKHKPPDSSAAAGGGGGGEHKGSPAESGLRAMKCFEVRASAIDSLKQEVKLSAKDNSGGVGFVSTGDCIIAHIWKALAKLPSSILGGKELAVSLAVEGRNRFYNPPLPDLCGNAVAPMVAPRIPPSELEEMAVSSIASRLRAKLHNTTADEWLGEERLEEAFAVSRSGQFASVRVTNWFGFPLYDIDFGFGKPQFVSGINSHPVRGAGAIYIGPQIPSSSSAVALVNIFSTKELLEALQCDPEFLLMFLPTGSSKNSAVS